MVARAPLLQGAVHQPPQPLHREVLEGERRPVKQFEQKEIVVDLDERRARRMIEAGIGVASDCREFGARKIPADIGRDKTRRSFGVGKAGKRADRGGIEPCRLLRDIEAPVAGEACQHRVAEPEQRRFAARGEITHVSRNPSARACVV